MPPSLKKFGINTEESFYRAHFCWAWARVFLFLTAIAKEMALSGDWPSKPTMDPGGWVRAKGVCVPWHMIHPMNIYEVPKDLLLGYQDCKTTSKKGRFAERGVLEMLKRHIIKLPGTPIMITDRLWQMRGCDIVLDELLGVGNKTIEVKNDEGIAEYKNIYLQTHECNPDQEH